MQERKKKNAQKRVYIRNLEKSDKTKHEKKKKLRPRAGRASNVRVELSWSEHQAIWIFTRQIDALMASVDR